MLKGSYKCEAKATNEFIKLLHFYLDFSILFCSYLIFIGSQNHFAYF